MLLIPTSYKKSSQQGWHLSAITSIELTDMNTVLSSVAIICQPDQIR